MKAAVFICYMLLAWAAGSRAQNSNPAAGKLKNFVRKYQAKKKDVTIVLLDGSISTDMGYATKRADAPYRPPCFTEYNLPSFIEEKLRWPGENYRRYDASRSRRKSLPFFSESENAVTVQYDSAWDWQNKPPVSNGYNGLTRILAGKSPHVAYTFPAAAKRCDFIYRTDYLSSAALIVHVTGKKGLVQLYNEAAGKWQKADGFIFSAKETNSLIAASFFPAKPFGATALRKSVYQKRLKMRCLGSHSDIIVSITSTDGGRLCYWGIAYSRAGNMLQFINSARGGHDIAHLEVFEPWSVDYWKPDLILYSCNTINEGADASAANTSNDPVAFTGRFKTFINILLNKSYHPDLFAYILFTARAHGLVDSLDQIGVAKINDYGNVTVFDFINSLNRQLKSMPIASANVFPQFWEKAQEQASQNHTTVFQQLFGSGGSKGPGFTTDDTHLNDRGALLAWKYLSRFFNY